MDAIGEVRLWQAVVNEALMDLSTRAEVTEKDIAFFFYDDSGLPEICMIAGECYGIEKVRAAARDIMLGKKKLNIKQLKSITARYNVN